MNNKAIAHLESRLTAAAGSMVYPLTPDLAVRFLRRKTRRQRRPQLAWAIAILFVALVSLLAVPEVRARLAEFLQIGAVRILLPQPTETARAGAATRTPTRVPAEIITSVLELDGEMTLESARASVDFPINLPTYPGDLGEPDHVFVQTLPDGSYVVLAWEDDFGEVELALYVIGEGVRLEKGIPGIIEAVEVGDVLGIVSSGEYLLSVDGFQQPVKLVRGPVLIWVKEGITYRLEAELDVKELIQIAESIDLAR
jgi:hypothetical protein